MPSLIYNRAKAGFPSGDIDWESDTIRVLLLQSLSTDDPDHDSVADVLGASGNSESTTTNYERKTLANASVVQDNANNRARLEADDVTWESVGDGGQSAVALVVFKEDGADGDSPLIALIDVTDTVLNGGDFTVQWSSDGIITLS